MVIVYYISTAKVFFKLIKKIFLNTKYIIEIAEEFSEY